VRDDSPLKSPTHEARRESEISKLSRSVRNGCGPAHHRPAFR